MTAVLIIRETLALVAYILIILVSFTSGEFNTIAATLIAGAVLFARAGDAPEMWYTARMLVRASFDNSRFLRFDSIYRETPGAVALALDLGLPRTVRTRGFRGGRMARRPVHLRPTLAGTWQTRPRHLAQALSRVVPPRDLWCCEPGKPPRQHNYHPGVNRIGFCWRVLQSATRISELAYFLPVVFMNASLPVLLEIRNRHGNRHSNYRRFLQRSYDQAFWAGLAIAALAGVAGTALITSFLGPEFSAAIPVLWISLCACPFIFMAAVFSK